MIEITPAPGVTDEEIQAHILRHKRRGIRCESPDCMACARFPSDGPTARWIKPATSYGPGFVTCPTCRHAVTLAAWWIHGCRAVSRSTAFEAGYFSCGQRRARKAPAARQPRKTWWVKTQSRG
jgi:hypothetical protein